MERLRLVETECGIILFSVHLYAQDFTAALTAGGERRRRAARGGPPPQSLHSNCARTTNMHYIPLKSLHSTVRKELLSHII